MQPLSKVKFVKTTWWGSHNVMILRPKIGVKVAQYIAEWSEIESLLGIFLGLLLHANDETAIAIYSSLENRAAQLRMLDAATVSALPPDHADIITVITNVYVRPAMKYRDKLAHWSWGYTDELPDSLLIREPTLKLENQLIAVLGRDRSTIDVPTAHDTIFVITENDLDRALKGLETVSLRLREAMASVWKSNTKKVREEYRRQLSSVPEIRSGMNRLREGYQKTPKAQPPLPPSMQGG